MSTLVTCRSSTGGSAVENQLNGVSNVAEIWNPATGTWTQGATGTHARLYHSFALLLPDATVLVGGGGAPGPLKNLNAEIYYPPYLFDASGQRAARPGIVLAPDTVLAGERCPAALVAKHGHAAVASARAPAGIVRFQHHGFDARPGEVVRGGEPGEAAADDGDVGLDIVLESRQRGVRIRRRSPERRDVGVALAGWHAG